MLTTAEEDRLEADLPLVQTIPYGGAEYQSELDPFWSGGDEDGADADGAPKYPALVFEWDSQAGVDEEREPLGDVSEIDDRGDDPEFATIETSRLSDELSMTIAVEATHDENGVPPQVRGQQITRGLWRYVRFEMDLNEPGANGERPMTVEPLSSPTPARVGGTFRLEWSVSVSYVDEYERVVETVDDAGYTTDLE